LEEQGAVVNVVVGNVGVVTHVIVADEKKKKEGRMNERMLLLIKNEILMFMWRHAVVVRVAVGLDNRSATIDRPSSSLAVLLVAI
jgi:hypothetical protein